jgi:hypothetical protein
MPRMGGFDVRTDSLRTARGRLQELGDDTSAARTYSQDHLEISGGDDGVLFSHVNGVAADVRARLDEVVGSLRTLLRDSGVELGRVARWYDESDEDAVRSADAQIAVLQQSGNSFEDLPATADTTPEDPGDYVPTDHGAPEAPYEPEDGETLMAPGPLGGTYESPSTGGGMV